MVVVAEEAVVVSVVVVVVVATTAVLVVTGTAELAAGRLEDAITEMQQQTSSIQSTAAARESSKNLTTHHESQKQSDDFKTHRETDRQTEARCKRLQIAHVNQCRTKSRGGCRSPFSHSKGRWLWCHCSNVEPKHTHYEKKHRQPFSSILLFLFFLRGFFWRCLCAAADSRIQFNFLKWRMVNFRNCEKEFFWNRVGRGGRNKLRKRTQKLEARRASRLSSLTLSPLSRARVLLQQNNNAACVQSSFEVLKQQS